MKLIKTISLAAIVLLVSVKAFSAAPKDFNGVIIYNISYESEKMDEQMLAMMPKTMKVMIKGNKSRSELSLGMGTQVTIFDADKKSGIGLFDMMGQKYAIPMTPEEIEKEMESAPDIEVNKTGNTKEIAGYTCEEAKVDVDNGKHTFTVYYTDELGSGMLNANNPYYNQIPGVMLEFAMEENDMKMSFHAISVEKKKVSDDVFEIPEGYKEMSQEQFNNMFGGGF